MVRTARPHLLVITGRSAHALVREARLAPHLTDVPIFVVLPEHEALAPPGSIDGELYGIGDIGMRMLEPHELLRAQFGRFAEAYDLSAAKTKSAKVRLVGNSVCPEVAEALVAANFRQSKERAA